MFLLGKILATSSRWVSKKWGESLTFSKTEKDKLDELVARNKELAESLRKLKEDKQKGAEEKGEGIPKQIRWINQEIAQIKKQRIYKRSQNPYGENVIGAPKWNNSKQKQVLGK